MYHSFLIHSSADGHLGCFHVLAIINSAAMNIREHASLSGFLCVYAQQWDCWVVWQFYFQKRRVVSLTCKASMRLLGLALKVQESRKRKGVGNVSEVLTQSSMKLSLHTPI